MVMASTTSSTVAWVSRCSLSQERVNFIVSARQVRPLLRGGWASCELGLALAPGGGVGLGDASNGDQLSPVAGLGMAKGEKP